MSGGAARHGRDGGATPRSKVDRPRHAAHRRPLTHGFYFRIAGCRAGGCLQATSPDVAKSTSIGDCPICPQARLLAAAAPL